jgi:phosphoribosylformylglycinamidine synthase
MRTAWQDGDRNMAVTAPVSLVVSAFAPVTDVRCTLTPELAAGDATVLLYIDLAGGATRLGGSCLAQTQARFGGEPADLNEAATIRNWFKAQRALRDDNLILAYHDRSDGGLIVTLLEMAFASRRGLEVEVPAGAEAVAWLLNEEPGVVIQVRERNLDSIIRVLTEHACSPPFVVARPTDASDIVISQAGGESYRRPRVELHRIWSELSFRMQALRDDPDCAREAYAATLDESDAGLTVDLRFPLPKIAVAQRQPKDRRPPVAVLREQGVNGQREMAAALDRAGFEAHDVHMSDLIAGRESLESYTGLVACGGFSYGDVLGAGGGWAKSILHSDSLRGQFETFFAREDSFALGVCNGCQMLASLKSLIPGAEAWPRFVRNRSDQFEARLSLVRIEQSPSILLKGMQGSRLPVVTSHGEGRAQFQDARAFEDCQAGLTSLRFVDGQGLPAARYPANPNGSPAGIAGLTSADGRVTIMMPHPERVFRSVQMSWHPPEWGECSPWQQLFDNALDWVTTRE